MIRLCDGMYDACVIVGNCQFYISVVLRSPHCQAESGRDGMRPECTGGTLCGLIARSIPHAGSVFSHVCSLGHRSYRCDPNCGVTTGVPSAEAQRLSNACLSMRSLPSHKLAHGTPICHRATLLDGKPNLMRLLTSVCVDSARPQRKPAASAA